MVCGDTPVTFDPSAADAEHSGGRVLLGKDRALVPILECFDPFRLCEECREVKDFFACAPSPCYSVHPQFRAFPVVGLSPHTTPLPDRRRVLGDTFLSLPLEYTEAGKDVVAITASFPFGDRLPAFSK